MAQTSKSAGKLRFTHHVLRITYFLRLGRPLFLTGGFLFHALGISIALYQGYGLNLGAWLWGQIGITAVQIMTHYSNDYFDLEADKANRTPTRWSGGSEILTKGLVAPGVALMTAVVAGLVALMAAVVLQTVIRTGPLTVSLFVLALTLAWSYSSPPLFLNRRGLGEITGAILIPGLTTLVGYYLQSGQVTWLPFLAIFPLSCLQIGMLLIINFPDAQGDSAVGKHTLVYKLGNRTAALLLVFFYGLAYISLGILVPLGLPAAVALALLALSPIAMWQASRMVRGVYAEPAKWNSLGLWGIGLLILSAAFELLAFLYLL